MGWQQVQHGLANKQQLIILCIEYVRFLTFLSLLDQFLERDTQELNRKLGILSRRLIEYTDITQISYLQAFTNFLLAKICWISKIIERFFFNGTSSIENSFCKSKFEILFSIYILFFIRLITL